MFDIIYILTNDSMPGLIKIGYTTTSINQRIRELDTTPVPLPFQCYFAARVENGIMVERKLHTAFGDFRLRSNREFFRLDPHRAKAAIELVALEDITPRDDVTTNPEDEAALVKAKQRRGFFRFSRAEIAPGALLTFARDERITATVLSDRDIVFEGQETSLSAAAHTIMQRLGYTWSAVAGPDLWLYDGETLSERRRRFEEDVSSEI